MRKAIRNVTAGILCGLASLLTMKETSAQQISTNISVRDKYVVAPGFIAEKEAVIQPPITLSKDGFYGMIWSNFNTKHGLSEVDYIAGYGNKTMGLDFDVSYNIFDFKDLGENKLNDNIHELWLSLTKQDVVSPSIRFIQNLSGGTFNNSKGNYTTLTLSHNRNIRKVPVSLEGSIQYNNKYFIQDKGFSIIQADFGLPFEVNGVSITPKVRFRKALDKNNFENSTDFGLSLGYNFGDK